ncbi:hypothetical protein [Spiroplasma poulsonii]|uniref:hypothetical protein n=1 Tax=Spiroplasma poulsonii TaxID=2138 RepID=UPI001F4CDD2C|nr:hypothetical protein [Spiroplasma poulsonii]UNF61610.1 hypothetical protein MNU24_06780 [Spiroplasma poulsonii]
MLLKSNQRPKRQNNLILVKEKHTIKTSQVIIEQRVQKIIATSFFCLKKHDYALFKESKSNLKNTKLIAG